MAPLRKPAPPESPNGARVSDIAAYVRSAVDAEVLRLSGTASGQRNAQLNQAAFALGQLVGGGHLAEHEALDALAQGAQACGLWGEDGERSCLATIRSGLNAGKGQPRVLDVATPPRPHSNGNRTTPTRNAGFMTLPHCAPGAYEPTDIGNADRLVELYGERMLWCKPWDAWLVWDGKRWKPDDSESAIELARLTARGIYTEAAEAAQSGADEAAKALAKWARSSSNGTRLRAMLYVARPDVATLPDLLDGDPWLLNVANGTLDLRTGTLSPHSRDDLLTKLAPVEYSPDAQCPTWDAFLNEVLASDRSRIDFMQRAIGYSLTGDTREQVLPILYGTGSNGKTTLLTTVQELLGDYARQTPSETLLDRRDTGGIPNDLAALKGVRMAVSAESGQGRRLAETKVKALTGGDRISARFMRAE